ncbi:MAG: GMC family oxidoreductase [Alphaproteobacteria bacterium]|nr:GMC family oxidoreductase [Alphaproteobacteria bacterium]
MIVDAQDLEPDAAVLGPADVCIAGAGAAGITIARELAKAQRRVILLEAGSMEISGRSQDIYAGENAGEPYLPLDTCRLRYFGGSTNHWGGWCRELDSDVFESRANVAVSGWPIPQLALRRHLDEAARILEIEPPPPNVAMPGSSGDFENAHWSFSPYVAFGAKYGQELADSEHVTVILNANLVDIPIDPDNGAVRGFAVRGYGAAAPTMDIRADRFVLACGGIENARILLNANRQAVDGIGNRHDLVGRYFSDHLHFDIGLYVDLSDWLGRQRRFVMPSRAFKQRSGILSSAIIAEVLDETAYHHAARSEITHELCRAAPELARWIYGGQGRECRAGLLRIMTEQAPNPASRVMLSDDRDEFGLRRVRLQWRRLPIDRRTLSEPAIALGAYYARSNLGRIKIYDWVLDGDAEFPDDDLIGGSHHMGTTRMAVSPRDGVVDPDCRVFDTPNLFIAGSSVFPTFGVANPTLSIVQLSLRLAEHLRDRA